ncbi:MAG: FAD-dependent oxidoreductase [Deltaproteobacteria bacterium]|nr:FAD-dependent oxidoreductase [Deltaproteobacteria bacterium]
MTQKQDFDLIIIGGGIAGMTAAIYAARANLKTAIVERQVCGGLVNSTYVIENFPSYVSINGMQLMEKVHEQVLHLGVQVEQVAEIMDLNLEGVLKRVETDERLYQAPALILATGCDPIRVPHLDHCEQVHYCSICDGPAYKGKRVVVVGGGNSGFDETLYLLSLGIESVTIVELMDKCLADPITQESVAWRSNVEVCLQTRMKEIFMEGGCLSSAQLENTYTGKIRTIPVEGIFVFIGQRPNTGLFADKVRLSERGYILADQDMQTNLPGVFAAGDVVEKRYRQIPTAMSDGAVAALSAGAFLRQKSQLLK